MKKRLLIAFLVLMSFCGVAFGGVQASAATKNTVELQKALLTDLRHCYINNKMKADLGVLSNYTSYNSIIQNDGGESYVRLPNDYTDINDDDLSCSQLLNGYSGAGGSFEGLFAMAGVTPPVNSSSVAAKESFLIGMGYEKAEASAGQCVAFYYKVETSTYAGFYSNDIEEYEYTYQLCSPIVSADGTIGVDKMEVVKEGGTELVEFEIRTNSVTLDCALNNPFSQGGCGEHKFTNGVTKWNDFVAEVLGDLAAHYSNKTTAHSYDGVSSTIYTYTLQSDVKRTNYGTVNAAYKLKSSIEDAANTAIKYLSNNVYGSNSDLYYTPAEQVVLYQTYLEDYYAADIRCDQAGDALTIVQAQGYKQVRIWRNGAFNDNCWALAKSNANSKANGLTDARWFTQERSFGEIAAALSASTVSSLTAEQAGNLGDTATDEPPGIENPNTPGSGEEPVEEKPSCFNGGGALGWILCPVLTGTSEAVNWAYETILEPFLNVDSRLFANESGDGTAVFNAWSIFQGFANIAFIILLLVVIFSQLTGVGIDNYGVKKILPKLIVSAVLINLSYIICQLLVDLSNVMGFSLRALFEGIASGVTIPSGTFAPDINNSTTLLTGVVTALIGALSIMAIATQGLSLILPLIIAMISGLIAVFFLFVLLGVRQAGVVLLVVVSPLAFACYMLPNTKKLFDRWRKMLQGLLLFFPICGLLIGAGELASKILLSTGTESFFMALTAMLLNVVPFFFLPMLLKASFAAMGNIGAKISGIGKGLNSKVRGPGRQMLDNTSFGQRMQRRKNYNQYRKAERGKAIQSEYQHDRAEKVIRKLGSRNPSELGATGRAALTGARQAVSAHESQQTKMYADSFASMSRGEDVASGLKQAIEAGDGNMMDAAIENLAARGDYDKITSTLAKFDPKKLAPMQDRLSNSLITHKKDAAHLWGWAKQMKSGNNVSLEEYAMGRQAQRDTDGNIVRDADGKAMFTANALQNHDGTANISMQDDMKNENDDLIATQDRTSLKAINQLTSADAARGISDAAQVFSNKQMINSMGSMDKEGSLQQYDDMVGKMSETEVRNMLRTMNAAQISKMKGSTMRQIETRLTGDNLKSVLASSNPGALKDLKASANAGMRAGMSNDVKTRLSLT